MSLASINVLAADELNGKHLPEINEFYWGTAAFLVIVGLFLWKGLGPLKKVLSDRTKGIADELGAAETDRQAAEAERDQLVASLGDIEAERARIMADARTQAETIKTELMAKADSDAAEMRAKSSSDLGASRSQASADLQSEMSVLTVASAEAVVENSLDEPTQRDLIESYINQVGSSN